MNYRDLNYKNVLKAITNDSNRETIRKLAKITDIDPDRHAQQMQKDYGEGVSKKDRQRTYHYPDTKAFQYIVEYLKAKGVSVRAMAQEAMNDQLKHGVDAPLEAYENAIYGALHKRDIDSLVLLGLTLDWLCTLGLLPEPLQSMMWNDAPAFSPDETICELMGLQYSGIAVTNYGARDVHKTGLAKQIDEEENVCNCFLDDFVSIFIAIAEAKVAHKYSF